MRELSGLVLETALAQCAEWWRAGPRVVEDAATLARLRRLGCDVGQGYHMGRPVSAEQVELGTPAGTVPDDQPGAVPDGGPAVPAARRPTGAETGSRAGS